MSSAPTPTAKTQLRDPRAYFAAERTLLAWIRTGLALMGFGFVVARFAVFLRELAVSSPGQAAHAPGMSLWTGTSLIAIGVAVQVAAALNHIRVIKRMNRGEEVVGRPVYTAVAVALALAVVGMVMALGLLRLR
jgi:putative membrane protein